MAISPSFSLSPIIFLSSTFTKCATFSLKSLIPIFFVALTIISLLDSLSNFCKSVLLYTIMYGIFFSLKSEINFLSKSFLPFVTSITRIATSVFLRIWKVFSTLNFPKSLLSSNPGVSIISTGPIGKSSIDLLTGSVVVPKTFETTESF